MHTNLSKGVTTHAQQPWDKYKLSRNPSLPWDLVVDNPDGLDEEYWDSEGLSRVSYQGEIPGRKTKSAQK